MKKTKTQCHICNDVMKTPADQQPPAFCSVCGANVRDPGQETRLLFTVVEKEAGGISAEMVRIYLTTRRVIFEPDADAGGTASAVGGAVGGLIGAAVAGAIAGAVAAAGDKKKHIVSVERNNIASLSEEPAGLLKNKIRLTLNAASGTHYGMTLSKKEAAKWKAELNKPMA